MRLPVMPPVAPMLAKSVAEIPTGSYSFEPKWDGFRSILFRDDDEVELGSRNERPMTAIFPSSWRQKESPDRCGDGWGDRHRPSGGRPAWTSSGCRSGFTRPRAG